MGNVAISLGQSLPRLFTNSLIILVNIVVLLPLYRPPGKLDVMEVVPFPEEITQLFVDKFNLMIVAMFKGTFIIALVKGVAIGLVFWIAGGPYTIFLTILSMFLSLVPLIGISPWHGGGDHTAFNWADLAGYLRYRHVSTCDRKYRCCLTATTGAQRRLT